jgi:DNA-binding HxlR family transcriptional regulator
MKIREKFTCPLELVHDMIKGKWKPIILWRLRLGKLSLSSLLKTIEGITEKMLLEQLKELINFGFVNKNIYDGYPLCVEYFLTVRGEKMIEALKIMQHIGIDHLRQNGMDEMAIQQSFLFE